MAQEVFKNVYIIIVSYNGMQWLPKCLETLTQFPAIIVDNGSSDGTISFIKSNYPDITLLEQKGNLGFGIGNNIGISYALKLNAEYVFLLNQDAYLQADTIKKLIKISMNNPDYGILSPIHLNRSESTLENVFAYYIKRSNNNLISDLLLKRNLKDIYDLPMVNAAAWLIPRKTLDIVGGFHPMFFLYGEDDNYCQRVLYHGLKIGFCPESFIIHDSGDHYHSPLAKNTEKYYQKFINQVKVKYADINTEKYKAINGLKWNYFKRTLLTLMKLNFKEAIINYKKWKGTKNLDFSKDILLGRQKGNHYLNYNK